MKSIFIKSITFGLALLIPLGVELFLLPIDYFNFRVWESLLVVQIQPAYGPFYPNMRVSKSEHGDVLKFRDGHPKSVIWETDRYGFRNAPRPEPDKYDIVIVGDSNVVGSHLDQKDTIAEVLRHKCQCETYSYAGMPKTSLFGDARFSLTPPRVVVVEARVGEVFSRQSTWEVPLTASSFHSMLPPPLAVLLDRIFKAQMIQALRSSLSIQIQRGDSDSDLRSADDVTEFAVSRVAAMRDDAHKRGSEFVFLLLPTPSAEMDIKLATAMAHLRAMGVKIVDYIPTSERPSPIDRETFYSKVDSHWSEETVRRVADDILAVLH